MPPTDPEQLAAIRSQTLAVIAAITAMPKPSYKIDGQAVMWAAYLDQLRRTVEWCDEKLAGAEPFEIETRGESA
ncbi:MAG: hypothetical protein K1X74_00565 [Pirellulales bacterium]|nr:hypothetical protein [Pirellulales bacterium]